MEKSLKKVFYKAIGYKTTKEKAAEMGLDVPFKLLGTKEEKQRLTKIISRVAKSELGKETLETAAKAGYTLGFVKLINYNGTCDNSKKALSLNLMGSDNTLVGTLTHEARHTGQFTRGSTLNLAEASLKKQIMMTRAKEADAQSIACATVFELKQKGDEGPYKQFSKINTHIVKPFEKALMEGSNSKLAAFNGWYDEEEVKDGYDDSQKQMLQSLEGYKNFNKFTFDSNISGKEIADSICVDKDGKSYFTDDPKILEKGKFAGVSKITMYVYKFYMEERAKNHGLEPDKSIKEIPVWSKEKKVYICEKDKDTAVKNQILAKAVQGR